jgi:lipoyl synthase
MNLSSRTEHILSKPSWIRTRWSRDATYERVEELLHANGVHTVCREAHCPNTMECWSRGTATFLILGDVCTRRCRFCAVKKRIPVYPDLSEPLRVAMTIQAMGLQHAVITSVTRDDLSDGGASCFSETIREISTHAPECTVEVLVPDFMGTKEALADVLLAGPDVFAHNVETIQRLYKKIRPQADYQRSLDLLSQAKTYNPGVKVKSSIMLGLGESGDEIRAVMADLRTAGCDMLTLGQYLRPTRDHFPVKRYWTPDEFNTLKEEAFTIGFSWVESGPLVRSSYRAEAPFRQGDA